MKNLLKLFMLAFISVIAFMACSKDDTTTDIESTASGELHAAFAAFNKDATTIYLDGDKVVIESTGLPNHKSVYWGVGNSLYMEESNVQTTPSIMSSNNNATTMTVDATPNLTGSTVATALHGDFDITYAVQWPVFKDSLQHQCVVGVNPITPF